MVRAALLALVVALLAPAAARAGQATIYRDSLGIPQIEASDDRALGYATGYALAQDRTFETSAIRLVSQGRLSELTGEGALAADQAMRRDYYDPVDVRRQYDALPSSIKDQLIAFAAGFNKGMTEVMLDPLRRPVLFDILGYTPERFQPTDALAVGILFSYAGIGGEGGAGQLANASLLASLSRRYGNRAGLRRWNAYLFKRDGRTPTVIPRGRGPRPFGPYLRERPGAAQVALARKLGASPLMRAARARQAETDILRRLLAKLPIPHLGSYGDAVGGARTRSGGALLQGSPQTGIDAPSLFWQLGQHTPTRDCAGFTVPGLGPWTGVGWCNDQAWSLITGNMGEQVDDYVEELRPGRPGQYRFRGRWLSFNARREVYRVNRCLPPVCSKPTLARTIVQTIRSSVHGPVVYEAPTGRFAVTQRRIQRGAWARSYVGLDGWNRARSRAAFNRATDMFSSTYNMVYADAAGYAGYRFTGWQPVRARGIDRRLPSPGTGGYEWRGRVPARRMPQYFTRGRDVLAVNQGTESKPAWWWPNSSSVSVGQISRVGANQRLLRARAPYDVSSFERDVYPSLLERQDGITPPFARLLRAALRTAPDLRLRRAYALFSDWAAAGFPRVDANGDGLYDSPAFVIFGADDFNLPEARYPRPLWRNLLRRTFAGRLGGLSPGGEGKVQVPSTWIGQLGTLKRALDRMRPRDARRLVRQATGAALDSLGEEFKGTDMTTWRRPVPTLPFTALGVSAPPPIKGFDHGTYSQIVDPRARVGRWIMPPGEGSADSASDVALGQLPTVGGLGRLPRHFTDQREAYAAYQLFDMPRAASQYTAAPESVTRLSYP